MTASKYMEGNAMTLRMLSASENNHSEKKITNENVAFRVAK